MRLTVLLLIVLLLSSTANAGTANAKQRALICANCHGEQGVSELELYPNLAGQKKMYLRQQLHKFRDGSRPSVVMTPIAKMLSDQDIEDLATYYAEFK